MLGCILFLKDHGYSKLKDKIQYETKLILQITFLYAILYRCFYKKGKLIYLKLRILKHALKLFENFDS